MYQKVLFNGIRFFGTKNLNYDFFVLENPLVKIYISRDKLLRKKINDAV